MRVVGSQAVIIMEHREALMALTMVARGAASEYARTSARASGSVTRLWRLMESTHSVHRESVMLVYKSTENGPGAASRQGPATTPFALGTLPVHSPQPCCICGDPAGVTTPLFLCHTANPYWMVCPACCQQP